MAWFYKDTNIILARAGSQRMGELIAGRLGSGWTCLDHSTREQGGDEAKSGGVVDGGGQNMQIVQTILELIHPCLLYHNEMQRKRGGIGGPYTHYGTEDTKVEHYLDGASGCFHSTSSVCTAVRRRLAHSVFRGQVLHYKRRARTRNSTLVDPRAHVRWVFNAKGVHVEHQCRRRASMDRTLPNKLATVRGSRRVQGRSGFEPNSSKISAPRQFNTVAHSTQAPRATGILVTPIIMWSVVTV
ncbi:hypothetical protein B0H14DRAFT_2639166 [Mycena olivaceomarginata]|nr:hypothetical protein B0H14DRAFT_2639166 [Mycena olivaceomarginata]